MRDRAYATGDFRDAINPAGKMVTTCSSGPELNEVEQRYLYRLLNPQSYICPEPFNKSPYLLPEQIPYMVHLGFTETNYIPSDRNRYRNDHPETNQDKIAVEFLIPRPEFDASVLSEYNYMRTAESYIFIGLSKYSQPQINPGDLDAYAFEQAKEGCLSMVDRLVHMYGPCRVVPLEFITFVYKASAGFLPKAFGCKKKRCAMAHLGRLYSVYWEHVEHLVAVASFSGKEELLPIHKFHEHKQRSIGILDVFWHAVVSQFVSEFNHRVYKYVDDSPFACGFNPYHGNFHHFCLPFEGKPWVAEGDISSLDGSHRAYDAELMGIFRERAFDDSYHNNPDLKRKFWWIMAQMSSSLVVTMFGQVLFRYSGNLSGEPSTTVNNFFVMLFNWYYCWCARTKQNWQSFYEHIWIKMYSDDHLIGMSDFAKSVFTASWLQQGFSQLGFKFDMAKYKVNDQLIGHTFLGRIISRRHNWYVPLFDFQKAVASLVYPGGKQTWTLRYIRAVAFYVLCFFDPRSKVFKDFAIHCTKQPGFSPPTAKEIEDFRAKYYINVDKAVFEQQVVYQVPSERYLLSFYLGYENGSLVRGF